MILNEKELIKMCEINGVEAFDTVTGLDWDTDIILNTDDIEEVFRLCKGFNEKVVFYAYTIDSDKENSEPENVRKRIIHLVENNCRSYTYGWFSSSVTDEEIEELVDKYDQEIQAISNRTLIDGENISSVTLDVFISHYGDRMGVSLCAEVEKSESDSIEDKIDDLVKIIVAEVEALYIRKSKEREAEFERERQERERRHNAAMEEIREELIGSSKILECTNGKLRHSYTKELVAEYSDKHDVDIKIGEVDVLVELEYKRRKRT